MASPPFQELSYSLDDPEKNKTINYLRNEARKAAYNLLAEINKTVKWDNPEGLQHYQVCSAESLTAGLIMATLVDIPWLGFSKYGCFGVYDTDAKRVMLGVSVDDVYTHKCAKEMAIGVLKNTNTSIAVAVTGNAMPVNEEVERLGEVFIGIAGYKNGNIIYSTFSINACLEEDEKFFKTSCKKWYNTIKIDNKYNPRTDTAFISQAIRYYTTQKALQLCKRFIEKYEPDIPEFIAERKNQNLKMNDKKTHISLPNSKYINNMPIVCKNDDKLCDYSQSNERVGTNVITDENLMIGGRMINKMRQFLKRRKNTIKSRKSNKIRKYRKSRKSRK